jgi:monovalent cation:H+ antiporter-2, CPA2 family
MHANELIVTLAGGLSVALVCGYVTHRIGLSPIVGYLLAGIIVGPHTPGFVADPKAAEQMSEIGVILLMFGVGLHFHVEELLAVRRVAIPGAIVQSLVATLLGAVVARLFGWDWRAGFVFGLALSVASTVVLTRVLSDNNDLHTPTGHIAVGWLVVEDLFTVIVLVLMPALFGPPAANAGPLQLVRDLGLALLKIAALVGLTFVLGGRVIPRVLDYVAASRSRELFTLTVLVIALGIAAGSTEFFGVSAALGAFLAGMVVGRSEYSLRAATEALPMRDAFAVLFFVSVGMLLNPKQILDAPGLIAATVAIVMLGKPLAAAIIVLVLRYPPKAALAVAIALAQIGEFSFILATIGKQMKVIPDLATDTLVAAAIVSITLNPVLYRLVDPIEVWASKRPGLWRKLNARVRKPGLVGQPVPEGEPAESPHRAVVIGYGPVGRTVTRLLRDNEIEPTVVELNMDAVRQLRADGVPAVYGDASHRDTLTAAGVAGAGSLILSSAGMQGSEEVIRAARDLNPDIRILARTAYVRELPALHKAGAQTAFSGEGEVALALTVAILQALGATAEQIDRERERVQKELQAGAGPGLVGDTPK